MDQKSHTFPTDKSFCQHPSSENPKKYLEMEDEILFVLPPLFLSLHIYYTLYAWIIPVVLVPKLFQYFVMTFLRPLSLLLPSKYHHFNITT